MTVAPSYDRELQVALDAVRQAAHVCQSVQATIDADVLAKKDNSPVTVADFGSQAVICRALAAAFPDDPVIAEEDSAELQTPENAGFLDRIAAELGRISINAGTEEICGWIDRGRTAEFRPRFWTLDPIDGTKGFLRCEQYAVSLALIVDGRQQLGVLGCPDLPATTSVESPVGALFYAIRGQGSYALPLHAPGTVPSRIHVTSADDSALARFCEPVESGHSSHSRSARIAEVLGIAQPPVRLDSQAKYAVVARGEADIYLRLPTRSGYIEKIWDHAGGVLVVEEAGGRVTDIDGKPLEFTHGRELSANRGLVVTNGRLHDRVLAAVRQVCESA